MQLRSMPAVLVLILPASSAFGAPPDPPAVPMPVYDLTVRLPPEMTRLEARGTVRLPPAAGARDSVEFTLSDQMTDLRVEVIEPGPSAGPAELTRKAAGNGSVTWLARWRTPAPVSGNALLRFAFAGGQKTAPVFHLGPECAFAGGTNTAWYPQLVESYGYGLGTIRMIVPPGYTAIATGVAAGFDDTPSGGTFVFDVRTPAPLSFAVARYTVVRRMGVVPTSLYLLKPRARAETYLERSAEILARLAQEFGEYAYGDFAIVEVPSRVAEKAGFSGASLAGFMLANEVSLSADFNTAYFGHEISHQWWGNLIGNLGSEGAGMLDEAMAQFGSLVVVEALEGRAGAEAYRRTGYPGYSPRQCGLGYLALSAAGLDQPLAHLSPETAALSHELADSKGFLVWDLLSRTVGRARFRAALRTVTRKYARSGITWQQFLDEVRFAAGRDIGWFVAQWLERTGAPAWQVEWKQQRGVLRGAVVQNAPFYRARLELLLEGDEGQRDLHVVEVQGSRTSFERPVQFPVRSVEVDPHFKILHEAPELRARAVDMATVTMAGMRELEQDDEGAGRLYAAALASLPSPDRHGVEFAAELGLAGIAERRMRWEEEKSHLLAAVTGAVREPALLPWAYFKLAQTARQLNDTLLLRRAVAAARSAEAAAGPTGASTAAEALLEEPRD